MLHPYSLYPHLTHEEIDQIIANNMNYDGHVKITKSDELLQAKLNEEGDMLQPIMSSGWRCSDIDSLDMQQDVRAQNILLSRMKQQQVPDSDTILSDDELIETVIPRNLMSSEISNYASEAIQLKENLTIALEKIKTEQSEQSTEQSE